MKNHFRTLQLALLFCLAFQPALSIAHAFNVEQPDWRTRFIASQRAFRLGNYSATEQELLAAMKIVEAQHESPLNLATCLDALANLYRIQGKRSEAAQLYRRSLDIKTDALGSKSGSDPGAR